MTFTNDLKNMILEVESYLDSILPPHNTYPDIIHSSMRYSVFAGGKRLRPILSLAACELVGGDRTDAMPYACAIELIHTYSLIHDDLPALDNDDYRRGKPTNHKVYGEDIAILAGDGLLNFAYEHMLEYSVLSGDCLRATRVIKEIANAVGVKGMISGQVLDIVNENRTLDIEFLDTIHRHKTGALIKASILSGAIVGGATQEQLDNLRIYGEAIGLGFQIMDDVLDVIGDESVVGKPIGSDISNNKCTYPTIIGIEKSIELTKTLTDTAIGCLDIFGSKKEFLVNMSNHLLKRKF